VSSTEREFKNDVDKFMDRIKKAINLRIEADRCSRFGTTYSLKETLVLSAKLREESDEILREAEYMLYEMIDNAMDDGARLG
jgi:hypothetical protein|tara:strand:- start:1160 stop:1405 length:246 start_codon:yes stop_codon:yes gene_type:complete